MPSAYLCVYLCTYYACIYVLCIVYLTYVWIYICRYIYIYIYLFRHTYIHTLHYSTLHTYIHTLHTLHTLHTYIYAVKPLPFPNVQLLVSLHVHHPIHPSLPKPGAPWAKQVGGHRLWAIGGSWPIPCTVCIQRLEENIADAAVQRGGTFWELRELSELSWLGRYQF